MNKNQEAFIISLVFLGLYAYTMYVFQPLSFTTALPFLGDVSFAFNDYGQHFVALGLLLTFLLFLKIRRERQNDESNLGQVTE